MPEVRTTSSTGGQKGTKLARFDLIPTGPLTELAEHYGIGASKYANHQWRKGYEWSKSYAALARHLTAFWAGQDYDVCSNDPEGCSHVDADGRPFVAVREDACFNHTGSHHMAAVAWHAFLLLEFKDVHQQHDDRYRPVSNTLEAAADTMIQIVEEGKVSLDEQLHRYPFIRDLRPEDTVQVPRGAWFVGRRPEDLVEAERPVREERSLRWVKDYDAERRRGSLGDFPRVSTGMPTLAEVTEKFGLLDEVDTVDFQRQISAEVARLTMAADRAVGERLREQFGPDLLSKRRPIKDTPQA